MFQVDKSLSFANFVNPKIAAAQRLLASEGISFHVCELVSSYGGDPFAGKLVPGTSIQWDDTSEVQGLIFEYYQVSGEANPTGPAFPSDLESILLSNKGPTEKWNGSYNDFGIPPGTTPTYPTARTAEVGTGRAVIVYLP